MKTTHPKTIFFLCTLLILLMGRVPSLSQVYNHDKDPDLAKALEYDLETNGGDYQKADRAKAETYYLAYLNKRKDLDTNQQARVYVKLGALYAVAVNIKRDERPDFNKARDYFQKALKLEPKRVGPPTMRARTMLAGMSPSGTERLGEWMKVYKWLRSIDQEKIDKLWLPSAPGTEKPSANELTKFTKGITLNKEAMETNMVEEAAHTSTPEASLLKVIQEFPDTPAAKLAGERLEEGVLLDSEDQFKTLPSKPSTPTVATSPAADQCDHPHKLPPPSILKTTSKPVSQEKKEPSAANRKYFIVFPLAIVIIVLLGRFKKRKM